MKEPEHDQAERQVEDKDAWKAVAEAAVMSKGNEVLEIGSKAADDQRRHDETGRRNGRAEQHGRE